MTESPNAEESSTAETQEFRSKRYGKRATGWFAVRSIAIWIVIAIPAVLMVAKYLFHNEMPRGAEVVGATALAITGLVVQWLAFGDWKKIDLRRVVYSTNPETLCIFQHRLTERFLSFGRVVPEFEVPLSEIQSHSIVKGRGRFLRLQTKRGFVSISNDINDFQAVCNIVESYVSECED